MSRGVVSAEVFRAEQVSRLARTSDPSNPDKGDAWIRTDVQPTTDSVAALRVQGDSGYLEAPLFDPSVSLGQDVYVGQRFVFDDGTEGHLLVTDQGGAVGSPRVVTSSGTEFEAHDATEVNVIPDSEIDHFEDGDISEYSGNTGAFTVQSTTVKEGSYALEGSMSSGNAVKIASSSGLPYYPQRGDSIGYWVRFSGDQPNPNFRWAETNSGADRYNLDYRDDSGEWRLRSRVGDSPSQLDSFAYSPTQGAWYYAYVEDYLSDGTIFVSIYEGDPTVDSNQIGTLSATNSDHDTGGISFGVNDSSGGSTTAYFDHVSYS
jgi:hypothetical protein